MSERFIKVFTGEENLYVDNAPVLIRASALLKDTETGKMIAQVKMQNVSGKTITYVKICLTQLDAVKKAIGEPVAFEYLDISVADSEEFGSKKALPLPSGSCRAFLLGVSAVAFSDGSIYSCKNTDWRPDNTAAVAQQATEETYQKAVSLAAAPKLADVRRAKRLFESIASLKDVTSEIASCERFIEEKAEEDARKQKKRKKTVKLVSILLCACILAGLLGYFVVYPGVSCLSGNYAIFVNMYKIKEFAIPNGVTGIGEYAFAYCDSLTKVTIPDSVTSIDDSAFYSCDGLTSINIPDSVTSIGDSAFSYCDSLTSITIPDSVTSIGYSAFADCRGLTSVTIGDSVTSIGDYAFQWCDSLTNVTIPGGVTSVGRSAFNNCTQLTRVTLPDSLTSIGEYAFVLCKKLRSITFEGTVAQWNAISKGSGWNGNVPATEVVCTDGTVAIR